ncbi:MAG: pentapeptide repeat-containing protein [Candidatus Micrarchaeota archaeon]|nr:pentapeptide repeat-containing protein [Candidatus Micrarchaeota archaeon]
MTTELRHCTTAARQESVDTIKLVKITRKEIEAAYLKGTREFSSYDMRGMDLRGANLFRAVFSSCDMRGADLSGANLEQATFRGVQNMFNLEGANLANARLEGAKFINADLTMARDFGCAQLLWTKYEKSVVTTAQFEAICAHIEKGVRKYAEGLSALNEVSRMIREADSNLIIVNHVASLERK